MLLPALLGHSVAIPLQQTKIPRNDKKKFNRETTKEISYPLQHDCGTIHVGWDDLEDLHPHMVYGTLICFLCALWKSLCFIALSVLSWRPVVVVVYAALVMHSQVTLHGASVLGMLVVVAEAGFWLWLKLLMSRLQRSRPLCQRLPAPGGALDIFNRSLACIDECASWRVAQGPSSTRLKSVLNSSPRMPRSAAEWLEGWFLGTPLPCIRRDNAIEWFAWAWFTKYVDELTEAEQRLAQEMLEEWERRYHWKFPEGYDTDVKSMRINFDSITAWCLPLTYYVCIRVLHAATRHALRFFGFTFHAATSKVPVGFFHSPTSPAPGFLVRDGSPTLDPSSPPIVFIHGLGVGIAPYVRFVGHLSRCRSREVFLVELPEIAQAGSETVLSPDAMVEAITGMLSAFGHKKACFVAHSYGTFVLSWIQRARPDIVAKLVLIDPVSLLLVQPDVAFNFMYRRTNNSVLMNVVQFLRYELFSANVIMRHFYWHHNCLWKDELPQHCSVVLSSRDDLLNAYEIRCYLEEHQRSGSTDVSLLWLEGYFHGGFLLSKRAQLQIVDLL
jgi:pimeloyl-ACP methyl ester carboxylesterase